MSYVSDRPVVREFNNQGQAMLRRADRYFLERNEEGGWDIVEPEDRFVSTGELGSQFGLWQDKEITEGHLWWKKTVRAKDGKVDQDEVLSMGQVLKGDYSVEEHFLLEGRVAVHKQCSGSLQWSIV